MLPPALLLFKGQFIEQRTVKWSINSSFLSMGLAPQWRLYNLIVPLIEINTCRFFTSFFVDFVGEFFGKSNTLHTSTELYLEWYIVLQLRWQNWQIFRYFSMAGLFICWLGFFFINSIDPPIFPFKSGSQVVLFQKKNVTSPMHIKVTLPKPDFCDCFGKFPLQTGFPVLLRRQRNCYMYTASRKDLVKC